MTLLVMKLVKSEFAQWLDDVGGDNIVGLRRDTAACPLACYLIEKTKRGYHVDEEDYWPTWGERESIRTPLWARQFINKIDHNELASSEVTAEEASYILNQFCTLGEEED